MGILIKGIEMPKDGVYWCEIGVAGNIATITIHGEDRKSFHLIELPDHGDLKDVNAIIQDVHDDLEAMTKIGIAVDADWIWAKFHDAIYSAPVVIPAERSEE